MSLIRPEPAGSRSAHSLSLGLGLARRQSDGDGAIPVDTDAVVSERHYSITWSARRADQAERR